MFLRPLAIRSLVSKNSGLNCVRESASCNSHDMQLHAARQGITVQAVLGDSVTNTE